MSRELQKGDYALWYVQEKDEPREEWFEFVVRVVRRTSIEYILVEVLDAIPDDVRARLPYIRQAVDKYMVMPEDLTYLPPEDPRVRLRDELGANPPWRGYDEWQVGDLAWWHGDPRDRTVAVRVTSKNEEACLTPPKGALRDVEVQAIGADADYARRKWHGIDTWWSLLDELTPMTEDEARAYRLDEELGANPPEWKAGDIAWWSRDWALRERARQSLSRSLAPALRWPVLIRELLPNYAGRDRAHVRWLGRRLSGYEFDDVVTIAALTPMAPEEAKPFRLEKEHALRLDAELGSNPPKGGAFNAFGDLEAGDLILWDVGTWVPCRVRRSVAVGDHWILVTPLRPLTSLETGWIRAHVRLGTCNWYQAAPSELRYPTDEERKKYRLEDELGANPPGWRFKVRQLAVWRTRRYPDDHAIVRISRLTRDRVLASYEAELLATHGASWNIKPPANVHPLDHELREPTKDEARPFRLEDELGANPPILRFKSMAELVRAAKASGSHFFDADTIKAWRSRNEGDLVDGRYFLTSERYDERNRVFRVRLARRDANGLVRVETVGNYYRSLAEARAALAKLPQGRQADFDAELGS